MRLSLEDKAYLKKLGYSEEGCREIEIASNKVYYDYKNETLDEGEVIELLGREGFLRGIARSAFRPVHFSEAPDGNLVCFDSSEYFEELKRSRGISGFLWKVSHRLLA